MRETRTSGSEGGAGQANAPSLPLSNGVQVPCRNTRAWEGRNHHPGPTRGGMRSRCLARRRAAVQDKPTRGRQARGKPRADGREPHGRPAGRVKVAQHTEGPWYAPGGKCGGGAAQRRAVTWGMGAKRTWPAAGSPQGGRSEANPAAGRGREAGGGHGSRGNGPECGTARQNCRRTQPDEGPDQRGGDRPRDGRTSRRRRKAGRA